MPVDEEEEEVMEGAKEGVSQKDGKEYEEDCQTDQESDSSSSYENSSPVGENNTNYG